MEFSFDHYMRSAQQNPMACAKALLNYQQETVEQEKDRYVASCGNAGAFGCLALITHCDIELQ